MAVEMHMGMEERLSMMFFSSLGAASRDLAAGVLGMYLRSTFPTSIYKRRVKGNKAATPAFLSCRGASPLICMLTFARQAHKKQNCGSWLPAI